MTSHLSQLKNSEKMAFYSDCEVVHLEIVETDLETIDVLDWSATDKTIRAKELEDKRYLKELKRQKELEIQSLERKLKSLKN